MKKTNMRNGIVAALSLGAFFMVYKNVLKPILGEPSQDATQSVSAPSNGLTGLSLISDNRDSLSEPLLGAARAVNSASLNYIFKEQRDPFTFPKNKMKPLRKYKKKSEVAINKIIIKNRPVLTAVMLGPVQKYALVDGEIVSEGESVNGVRVVKIAEDTVLFEGHDGKFTLKLTTAQIGKSYE